MTQARETWRNKTVAWQREASRAVSPVIKGVSFDGNIIRIGCPICHLKILWRYTVTRSGVLNIPPYSAAGYDEATGPLGRETACLVKRTRWQIVDETICHSARENHIVLLPRTASSNSNFYAPQTNSKLGAKSEILLYKNFCKNIIIIIVVVVVIIIYLSCSWVTCWPVPVSRIQKSLQRSTMIPSASWGAVFHYPG